MRRRKRRRRFRRGGRPQADREATRKRPRELMFERAWFKQWRDGQLPERLNYYLFVDTALKKKDLLTKVWIATTERTEGTTVAKRLEKGIRSGFTITLLPHPEM